MKQTEQSLTSKIKLMVDDSKALTSQWESNNQKWHKMRMRIKKTKTFPFVGCANLRMPTIETKLRKLKAALVNVIFGMRPIVQAIPTPSGNWQTAIKIEKFLDHLMMNVMKIKSKSIIAIDQMIEKGFYLIKPYWKTDITTRIEEYDINELPIDQAMWLLSNPDPEQIKQAIAQKFDVDMNPLVAKENKLALDKVVDDIKSGKTNIKAEFQDVICNYPDIALAEPERTYVSTDTGYDPQESSYIIHEFFLPLETLKLNAKTKNWDLGEIEDLENTALTASKDTNLDVTKDLREGIQILSETGKVKVWEFYGYYDINDDGVNEKCVITIAPDFDKVLRKITLPFYSGKYPFVKLFYELTDDRWFSHRGIPELIEDIVKEIDIQHCQKIDNQTMRNVPMYFHRAGMINKNTIQFLFGQSIPVQGMQPLNDILQPLNNHNPNVEFSYEREQMILESKVEELIGQVDFTLQSMINKRQPRTLGEVEMQQQNMQNVFSLDADMCRGAFEDLFNWIWELWCQYGDDVYEFSYFGKEGYEPIRLTKEEIQGKYKITVRGNDQNTNPQVRLQKAQMILGMSENQIALQTGVVTPMNLANAYKMAYQELDIQNWQELVTMPQPPPPQFAPLFKPKFKDLTDAEQAQVLANAGVQPDVQGRSLKSQAKIQEKHVEQEGMELDNIKKVAEMNEMGMAVGGNE